MEYGPTPVSRPFRKLRPMGAVKATIISPGETNTGNAGMQQLYMYSSGSIRAGLSASGLIRFQEPGAPVADPGKLHLLQPPSPLCGEPPVVITDALIVHPHPQAVESALIGRHAPVAVLLME